jgi:hypothetical protein
MFGKTSKFLFFLMMVMCFDILYETFQATMNYEVWSTKFRLLDLFNILAQEFT